MVPAFFHILLVRRKSCLTLHLWNPADLTGLERAKPELTRAGFQVMRGFVQFSRNRLYPVDAIKRLLQQVRDSFKG